MASPPDTDAAPVRFGTCPGVFRPVFLTILGALLYLQEGGSSGTPA
ncbi:MAG: hypothetical protein R3F59_17810 [Myxococcota bacterium]